MTRRGFIHKLLKAGSAVIAGAWWFLKETIPRKFIWAGRVGKYPGRVGSLGNISEQSKWSG